MYRPLLKVFREEVSGDQARKTATEYRAYPLKLGFQSYNDGIAWIRDCYAGQGFQAAALEAPADGRTLYGDHRFPLAWDIDEGWIKVSGPDEIMLADYAEDPYGIVPFCADSGGVQEGVIIPAGALREKGVPAGARNVVVLFDGYTYYDGVKWAKQLGCGACIVHMGASPEHPIAYRARRWFNDLFGEGQIDARHKTLPAFSVSSEQAAALVERFRHGGPIPATYLVRSRAYAGKVLSATARIVGTESPDVEVLATAHAYEPNASNNVSGVAICLEAARAIAACVRTGRLSPPRRSIRFFHGLEMYGLYEYALRNRNAMQSALCGVTVDCLGAGCVSGHQERLRMYRCHDFNPSFVNGLFAAVLSDCADRLGCRWEVMDGYCGNDDVLQDPMFGPAWAMLYGKLMFDAGFYHTNADTPEVLSREHMAEYAALVATVVYFAANAGREEAGCLAALARNEATARFMRFSSRATENMPGAPEALRERAMAFNAFSGIAIPAGIAAIQSTEKLLPEAERKLFLDEIAPDVKAFQQAARYMTGAVLSTLAAAAGEDPKRAARFARIPTDEIEKKAAHMVPRRRLPGSLGLGALSLEERREASRLAGSAFTEHEEFWHYFAPEIFWLDGKRSVLDAALAVWSLSPGQSPDSPVARKAMIEKFVAVVEFLERHGYVDVERRPIPAPVTKADIRRGLESVGIASGDIIMVHSKMSAFGHVEGGAETVIDALLETVGPEGIVAMPTLTCTAVGESDPPFDPESSPVYTGQIPETFRRRKNVLRSWQPTHSVAAVGARATEFLRSENPCDTFDPKGPWGKLYEWGGKLLFTGTRGGGNTYVHALEAWLLNYLDVAFARVKEGNGEKEVLITNYPDGCRGGWDGLCQDAEYFKYIHARGIDRQTEVGSANLLVIEVKPFTHAVHELFRKDPATLAPQIRTPPCAERRARLEGWKVPDEFPI